MHACLPYVLNSEPEIKFETYRFYLECFREHLLETYRDWQNFGLVALNETARLQGMREFNEQWIERFLKISWNTEYLVSVGADDAELVRINNQWLPIQGYYAIYACAEAVAYALDGEKADAHHKALRKVTDYFVKSGLSPWDKAFGGARGKNRNDHKPVNFPEDLIIPHNLQRKNVGPLEMIAKCLKAEHSHRIDDNWNRSCCISKYCFDPGNTGMLHFLYRLRIKSNYKEVDLFVSEAPPENVRSFAQSIRFLCFWSLLYMEIIIVRKCRKQFFLNLGNKYLNINPQANHLQERLIFYKDNV